jgi:hypothetical protein
MVGQSLHQRVKNFNFGERTSPGFNSKMAAFPPRRVASGWLLYIPQLAGRPMQMCIRLENQK